MIRSPATTRRMAWLALVAVVLMAVVPTVSRITASLASHAGPVLMELCTTAGRVMVDVSPFIGEQKQAHAMADMGHACDYCALLPPLQLLLLALLVLLLRPSLRQGPRHYQVVLRPVRNLRGLGSQAPPLPL